MKFDLKSLTIGAIIGVTSVMAVPALAKDARETIDVTYRNIKIYADGNLVNTSGNEAFIYNGTTYLPVRAVGTTFGKAVDWDAATSSVYIGSKPSNGSTGVRIEDIDYFNLYNGKYFEYASGELLKDNTGTEHSGGLLLGNQFTVANTHGYIEYLLDGKYRSLKTTVALTYEERNSTSNRTLRIYGDDTVLYETTAKAGFIPDKIELDLRGVKVLRMEIVSNDSRKFICLYDCNLFS